MDWLLITVLAYFLLALEIVLDKFFLSSKRVSHPALYAFYGGTTGLFALVFAPFGFHSIGFVDAMMRFVAGMIFIYGMLCLFFALNHGEASRVTPVVGAVVPIAVFLLSHLFLHENLRMKEIWGIVTLIIGGIWISYDFKEGERKIFKGFSWSILAGILLAIAATSLKRFYIDEDNFVNPYIWTRIGAFLGVLTFFLVPEWRKKIFSSLAHFKKPAREHKQSGALYILTRAFGGSGSILKEKATSMVLASVTIVNALVAVEYVFVFMLGIVFSLSMPQVFEERKDWKTIIQKIIAIIIIAFGLVLVSKK